MYKDSHHLSVSRANMPEGACWKTLQLTAHEPYWAKCSVE